MKTFTNRHLIIIHIDKTPLYSITFVPGKETQPKCHLEVVPYKRSGHIGFCCTIYQDVLGSFHTCDAIRSSCQVFRFSIPMDFRVWTGLLKKMEEACVLLHLGRLDRRQVGVKGQGSSFTPFRPYTSDPMRSACQFLHSCRLPSPIRTAKKKWRRTVSPSVGKHWIRGSRV